MTTNIIIAGLRSPEFVLTLALMIKGLGHTVLIADHTAEHELRVCFPFVDGVDPSEDAVTRNGIGYSYSEDGEMLGRYGADVVLRLYGYEIPGSSDEDALILIADEKLTTIRRLEAACGVGEGRSLADIAAFDERLADIESIQKANDAQSTGCFLIIRNYVSFDDINRFKDIVWAAVVNHTFGLAINEDDYRAELTVLSDMTFRHTKFSSTYIGVVGAVIEGAGIRMKRKAKEVYAALRKESQ